MKEEDQILLDGWIKHQKEEYDACGYEIVALSRGHDILVSYSTGGYQGEWIVISFDPKNETYCFWAGYFGSCSGCDHYIDYFDDYYDKIPSPEKILSFIKEYTPYHILSKEMVMYLSRNNKLMLLVPLYQQEYGDLDYSKIIKEFEEKLKEGNK